MPNPSPTPRQHFNSRPSARGDNFYREAFDNLIISIHAPPRGATHGKGGDATRHAISIHAPPRGATKRPALARQTTTFQFTPLREGRRPRPGKASGMHLISIHAPPRGATRAPARQAACTLFQFTPLREGRRQPGGKKEQPWTNFNSRPSARGDHERVRVTEYHYEISIHAPPRGATDKQRRARAATTFQFTPLREGRPDKQRRARAATTFQFTPLREGRPRPGTASGMHLISIHAPPRGATPPWHGKRHAPYFNSRPSARGDGRLLPGAGRGALFQFTPLREGRRGQAPALSNPGISIHAPPRGATRATFAGRWARRVFQFTPLREGRRKSVENACRIAISIHAPPRGATRGHGGFPLGLHISIHAPPRGATNRRDARPAVPTFQFTPLREGRRNRPHRPEQGRHFNSRPSARGDARCAGTAARPTIFQFTPLREGRQQKICNFCKSFVQPLQISMA